MAGFVLAGGRLVDLGGSVPALAHYAFVRTGIGGANLRTGIGGANPCSVLTVVKIAFAFAFAFVSPDFSPQSIAQARR